jgi:hypothetical protein
MQAQAAQFDRQGPAENDVVIQEERSVLERRFEHRAQAHEQRLVVARYPLPQRIANAIIRPARKLTYNRGDESPNTHALLMRGDAHALGETAADARKRSLGDHLVGAGMNEIRNQHGVLRFSYLFQPLLPSSLARFSRASMKSRTARAPVHRAVHLGKTWPRKEAGRIGRAKSFVGKLMVRDA